MEPKIKKKKITDYQPDPQNANRGTLRGTAVLEDSFRRAGAGRSLLADRNGVLIAGNKSQEGALNAGIEDVIEVETDGNTVVVVKRTDLDLTADDDRARLLAYLDNRAGELSLDWNPEQVLADIDAGINLEDIFRDYEIDDLIQKLEAESMVESATQSGEGGGSSSSKRKLGDSKKKIKPVLYAQDVELFEKAILKTGIAVRGEAVIAICRYYLEQTGGTE